MKYYPKKIHLLGLFLLAIFCLVGIVSITSGVGVQINTNPTLKQQHRGRLHTLFLENATLKVYSGSENLTILNGLIVGSGVSVTDESLSVMIGGGENNSIGGKNSGIAGGNNNIISDGENSAIGGGSGNYAEGENAIVAGGVRNVAENGGIVVGGYLNTGVNNGIVLGGTKNYADGESSLVMGKNATGVEGSFSWNANNSIKNSVRIDAQNGVLIGTNQPKVGIRLVVDGSMKLGASKSNTTGAIQMNSNGCFMMYDGSSWQVLGKLSANNPNCDAGAKPCKFGSTTMQEGDIVIGYSGYFANDCSTIAQKVICIGGNFYSGDEQVDIYPYCYDLSPDKSLDTNSKNTICKGLIPNAHRVNGYFKQRLEGGVWTPTSSPEPQYTSDSNKSCSYQCNDGFEFRTNPDRCTCDINIEYDCNEGKVGGSTVVEYGNRPTTLSKDACSREGYELVGWSWDKNAENPAVLPGAQIYSLVQCKNYTLYAVRKKSYTITYNCNGGEGNPEEQHVVCGQQAQLSSTGCTKENAKLTGWDYIQRISGLELPNDKLNLGSSIRPTICQSFTLHARYETYNCNGDFENATLVTGSDKGLTSNVDSTLYANLTAAGDNKCAYVCQQGYNYNQGKCELNLGGGSDTTCETAEAQCVFQDKRKRCSNTQECCDSLDRCGKNKPTKCTKVACTMMGPKQ